MNRIFNAVGRVPGWWWDLAAMGTGAGAGVASYAMFHEPLNIRMDTIEMHLNIDPGRLPRQGLRILHLSDTHFRGAEWREAPKIEQIHRRCRDLEYDLLVHTGDFLHYDSGLANIGTLLEGLPRPRLGSYAVLGNHDYMTYSYQEIMSRSWQAYQHESHRTRTGARPRLNFGLWAWAGLLFRFGYYFFNAPLALKRSGPNNIARLEAELARHGVEVLYNRAIHLGNCPADPSASADPADSPGAGPKELDLWIAGVDDLTEGTPNLAAALRRVPRGAPLLLLAHNPDILQYRLSRRAHAILSGHTHGGQIVLPFVGAAHTQTAHLRRQNVSGYLRREDTHIYISRGIGEGIPLRFAAPPQIALVTLYPKT